jgi:hypothetical protein
MTRTFGTLAGTAVLALALTACGSGGHDAAGSTGGDRGFGRSGGGAAGADRRPPGVSGKVAAVSGRTAQVQDETSQTAVTWTARTAFTAEVGTTAAAVKVGACVIAQPDPASAGSSTPDPSSEPTTVTAARVRIVAAGDCARRAGGERSFAGRPSGAPSGRPSDAPTRRFGVGAVGEVTALAAHGFTVQALAPPVDGASPRTRTVSVTTTSATTYSTTQPATAAAVVVGVCLTAQGRTDAIGGVTATRIEVTRPVDGQCGLRVLRNGPGGPGAGTGDAVGGAA